MNDVDISFFVACYNEEKNICRTLDTLLGACRKRPEIRVEILVIDDCSRDGSAKAVEAYLKELRDDRVRLMVNEVNRGLGFNYIEGAFQTSGKYYRGVWGDDVEPEETFLLVLDNMGKADVIVFYETETPGKLWWRVKVSGLYTKIVNFLSGYRLRYYNGIPLYRRRDVMRWQSLHRGFAFQADLLVRILNSGATYLQVRKYAHERTEGKSTAYSLKNFLSVGHFFFELILRRIVRILFGPKWA